MAMHEQDGPGAMQEEISYSTLHLMASAGAGGVVLVSEHEFQVVWAFRDEAHRARAILALMPCGYHVVSRSTAVSTTAHDSVHRLELEVYL